MWQQKAECPDQPVGSRAGALDEPRPETPAGAGEAPTGMTVTFSDSPISAKESRIFLLVHDQPVHSSEGGLDVPEGQDLTSVVIVPRTVERDDNSAPPRVRGIIQLGDLLKLEEAEVELQLEHVCVGEPEFILKLGEVGSHRFLQVRMTPLLGFRFDDLDAGRRRNLEVNLVGGMVDDVPRILGDAGSANSTL